MRRPAAAALAFALGTLAGPPAVLAQTPGPPGPYVVDLRGTTSGLPKAPAFFPAVPPETLIPRRAFGVDVGGHIYLMRLGQSRIGLGVNFIRVRGTSSPLSVAAGTTLSEMTTPSIHATFTAIAPQLSFNFGTASGWSYLSGGLGRAQIVTSGLRAGAPDVTRSSGQLTAVNYGGGARWFLRKRLGIGFDIRFHKLPAGEGTPEVTQLAASVGVSVR